MFGLFGRILLLIGDAVGGGGLRSYLLKRLLLVPVTLFGITLISFLIIHLAPGDPASLKRHGMSEGAKAAKESRRGSEDAIKKWRAQYDLDRPVPVQYAKWLGRLAHGDLGKTFFGDKDVREEIQPYLWVSICLETVAFLLIFAIAIPLGILSAWRPESLLDRVSSFVLFVLYSLPSFWAATMLIIWFGNREHAPLGLWFPVSGLRDDRLADPSSWEVVKDLAHHTFLPILCLSYGTLAVVSRYMRAGMLEVIRQDFVRTARAKGLPERTVILKHALRNALFPVVTLAASLLPIVVAGSIIVEVIFTIPGMGWYAYDAIQRREYNILMATFLLSGLMELVAILVADVAYAFLDPRVSYDRAGE
jgi:peptide/nickel transport system permease protein